MRIPHSVPPTTWVRGARIGEGDNSRVYVGLRVPTGSIIAVKEVDLRLEHRDHENAQYHAELSAIRISNEVLKDLDHPNVVRYLGIDLASGAQGVTLQLSVKRLHSQRYFFMPE